MKLFKDISTEQFWLTIWAGVVSGFVLLFAMGVWSGYQEDKIIKDLIEQGQDPLELTCLFNSNQYNEAACLLLMQGEANKRNDTKKP